MSGSARARPFPLPCLSREVELSVECLSEGQLCDPPIEYECIGGQGDLEIEFTAAVTHCSDMRFLVAVDDEERPASEFLGPGQSTGPLDFGHLEDGEHVIRVQAEGREGGCNGGGIATWGGTLRMTVTP